jgi:hypothetical protein
MTLKPAMSAADYAERTRDENKQRELHPADCGAIDLDAFQAMTPAGRSAVWAVASEADRRGLALQCIRRANHGPDEATIALYLELLEAKFGSDLAIPTTADILETVKERHATALRHEDYPGARQLDRVRQNMLNGARLTWHLDDLLIQSVNNPGAVYSVNRAGCTCPNGQKGKSSCWHVALYDLLLEMQDDRAAAADLIADAAAERAEAELDEAAATALAWEEHEAEQRLWARIADVRARQLVA